MNKFIKIITRPLGIRNRLLSMTVAITLFISFSGLFINHYWTESFFEDMAKDEMLSIADEIKTYDLMSKSFYQNIAQLEITTNAYIEIYLLPDIIIYSTKSNNYLYDSDSDSASTPEPKGKNLKILEQPEINPDGSFFDKKQEIRGTAKYIVYNSVINDDYAVKIYLSLDVIESNAMLFRTFIMILCVLVILILIAVHIVYESLVTKPLITINNSAKQLAALNFDVKCPTSSIVEMDELGKNINLLSTSLDMALFDLQEKNKQLELDIQKEQQLDKARTEFISNASHELKTPIAIIQGYAEGLKVGIADKDSADEYCDIIMEETQKMNTLVVRMLEICQYESGGYKLMSQSFNIYDEVYRYLRRRIKLLKEDGITLVININPEYRGYGDISKIETIINNYVSNAVSHVKNENLIVINCQPAGDKYRLSVFNTGSIIADEDIDNIWSSFYRADKAHSRATGRFGLGLSFVKSIQELHNNSYGVINRDNGVEFWFDISKAHNMTEDDI
ncbi:MAG: HAMP domain-containing histidine kinase [Clostridia bacterium]|nr:HAMP domain-containing histidine kinase [Clostridia bacterium]